MKRALMATTVLALLLPAVPAHPEHCPPHPDPATAMGPLHLTADGALYQESNGSAGLQRNGGSCEDENGRTRTWAADTRIL